LPLPQHALIIQQPDPELATQKLADRQAAAKRRDMTVELLGPLLGILIALIIGIVLLLAIRRWIHAQRSDLSRPMPPGRRAARPSAWEESGRRARASGSPDTAPGFTPGMYGGAMMSDTTDYPNPPSKPSDNKPLGDGKEDGGWWSGGSDNDGGSGGDSGGGGGGGD
jgi:uncharacterized membrane protein YgcG